MNSNLHTIRKTFLLASELTEDVYWKNVFISASRGRMPMSFAIKDGYLIYRNKKKPARVALPLDCSPEVFMKICREFFQKTTGLMSDVEKTNMLESADNENVPTKWSQIRKPGTKKALINGFVNDMKIKHNLTTKEIVNLRQVIQLGIILGSFSDMTFENGRISEIKGLKFEDRVFYFEKSDKTSSNSQIVIHKTMLDELNLDTEAFIKRWTRYVKNMNKLNIKA